MAGATGGSVVLWNGLPAGKAPQSQVVPDSGSRLQSSKRGGQAPSVGRPRGYCPEGPAVWRRQATSTTETAAHPVKGELSSAGAEEWLFQPWTRLEYQRHGLYNVLKSLPGWGGTLPFSSLEAFLLSGGG